MFSSFKPMEAMKDRLSFGINNFPTFMRNGLVVFQLVISLILIMGSLVAYKQIRFMNKLDNKVEKDNVIVVRTLQMAGPSESDTIFVNKVENLKNTLNSYPIIEGLTLTSVVPGFENQFKPAWFRRSGEDEGALTFEVNRVDYDFQDVYKPEIIAGRSFKRAFQSDKTSCMINLEALKQLGFKNTEEALAQGLVVGSNKEKREILGVIDYHTMASKQQAAPEIFLMDLGPTHFLSIKVSNKVSHSISEVLDLIGNAWSSAFPDRPFEFFILDDFFASQYQTEQKLKNSLIIFASLAIALACLGLYGLTTFTYTRRTKEMAVRKILGSSVPQIIRLLLKDVVKLLGIAGIIFPPVIYYLLNRWLENFHYRIQRIFYWRLQK
jgi:putative ABC transport system permease protein